MKKYLLLLVLASFSFSLFAQEEEEKPKVYTFSAGLGSSMVFNINSHLDKPIASDAGYFTKYFTINPTMSYGTTIGIRWSEKVRTRFMCNYMRMTYGADWATGFEFTQTKVYLYMLDFDINFDILVYSKNKWQVFASPGLITEYVTNHDYRNETNTGRVSYGLKSPMKPQYQEKNYGANFGFIARYNLSKRFAFDVAPSYSVYLSNFSKDNSKLYSRFTIGAGVNFQLF